MRIVPPNLRVRRSSDRHEQLYNMLLDAIPSSVLLIDRKLRIVSANRNFLEKSRRTLSNTIERRLEEVFPAVIIEQMDIARRIQDVINGNQPVKGARMTYRAPGVPIRIYYYSLLPFSWQGRIEGVILLMDDVTEQLRLSSEVRRVEQHLASIVESASDLVLSLDRTGRLLTWNAAAERLAETHIGRSGAMARGCYFYEFCADEDQEALKEVVCRIVDKQKYSQPEERTIKTRQSTIALVSWVFSPLKDSSNETVGVVAVGRDLTERRKFEAELIQSQKLAALGVMAGGIAHEIRNPLAICSSAAQFLVEEDTTPEFRRECAEKIHRGIQRASAIIENLLRYSHPSTVAQTALVNLVALIQETLTLVADHATLHKIETRASFPKSQVMVQGVATLLQQVFMNLFLNAINAMPAGGVLRVDVRTVNGGVRIRVADVGCGIRKDNLQRVFDPFYTTSPVGSGTGLGLAICYSIVKQHAGSIEVESTEGKGSIFTVRLPSRDSSA